jgi:hypothetical protein
MNIIELQDSLKDLPDSALMREMQMPSGTAPQFLVLSELKRRKRMRDDFQRRQNADMKTVAEEVVTAAGAPQEGIMQVSRAMNPESSIAQNTGMDTAVQMPATQAPQPEQPMMMADGGEVRYMREGSFLSRLLGFGSDERNPDVGRPVEPFPANSPNPRDRSNWMAMYKDTHNLDGSPKSLSPDVADTEGVSALSANIEDYMAPGIDMQTQDALSGAMGSPDRDVRSGIAALAPPVAAGSFDAITSAPNIDAQMGTQRIGIGTDPSIRDALPESVRNDDLRFSRGTASSIAPSEGSDQIADMIAGSELSRLSGAIPLADAVSEMSGNAPIDFDASTPVNTRQNRAVDTPAYQNLQDIIRERMDIADRSRASSTSDSSIAPDVDLSRVVAMGSDGSVEPESGFFDFLPSLRTSDEDNPMVQMVEDAIDAYNAPEVRSPDDVIDAQRREAANTLSGSEFSLAPDQGYPFPVDVPEETSPETDPYNALNILPALTETSSGDEIVEKATEIMEERNIPLSQQMIDAGFTGGDIDPSDLPALTVSQQAAEEAGVSLDAFGDEGETIDLGGDGGGGSSTTTSRSGANFGSIESRISQMLADREKSAEADKWMALAQAGMALMASKNPTFGGALGEAGLLGVGAMQKARQQYDDDILGLLGMQQKIQTAKAAAAKAGTSTKGLNQEIDDARAYLNSLQSEAKSYRRVAEGDAALGTTDRVIDMTPPDLKAGIIEAQDRLNTLMQLRSSLGTSTFDATK